MAETFQQLDALHARMEAMLAQQSQHALALGVTMDAGNPAIPDTFEANYAGFDDNREDRVEYGELDGMTALHERLDALQYTPDQGHDREREGMGY